MIEDIYEPLALFRDSLKEQHRESTAEFFEELVRRSGVDEAANKKTVAVIRKLDTELTAEGRRESRWKFVRLLFWLVTAICVACLVLYGVGLYDGKVPFHLYWSVAALVGAGGTIYGAVAKLNPLLRSIREQLQKLQEQRASELSKAWQQMAPLNRLYDWDMGAKLVQQTVPRLELDPYMTNGRLEEMRQSFGWSDNFNSNKSVLCTLSGHINGNPFVVVETLDFHMGTKTYTGSKMISWQELERYTDSQGRSRTRYVTRHQTLTASVTKPAPEHSPNKMVIYANEAAPTLTFSRHPSELSTAGDGVMDKWRKSRKIKQLEKLSRNLDDDSGYTIMSNKEFAALFHATDRNDEVQFRLLFTPMAQQQMVLLLKDKEVGYGDNFLFRKERMINMVEPSHLAKVELGLDPSKFHSYDLAAARQFFNDFNNDYFKAIFFAMAPLLTIPLYQQHRSHADIYKDVYSKEASFWEHEAIANAHGQNVFRHPDSKTPNILKTVAGNIDDGVREVAVTAYGFRTEQRTDYVSKLGGDGRWHQVPVEWTEYLPVSRTTPLAVREVEGMAGYEYEEAGATPEWQEFFEKWKTEQAQTLCRRSLVSFVKR